MGIGARGRGPQAPSPISPPNQLFELLRCSGRLIELPPRHPAFRRAGVPFGLLAVSAPSRLTACWRSVRLIGCAKRSNSSRFATYGKPKRRTPVASRPTASPNARPPGSLRSPSVSAPKPSFRRFRCFAWFIHDFAPSPMRALVFRSAYSASRNARASAAFAASIKAHCAVSSETLMLQVRCANPPMPHRTGFSSRSGVPHGLFSLSHRLQNAG